jgi:hypothetical protein
MAAKIPMIATTIINSISVKPLLLRNDFNMVTLLLLTHCPFIGLG